MTELQGIWRTLDLAPTVDTSAIRKAYAGVLKTFDIDDDPERYSALRDARDAAIAQARSGLLDEGDEIGSTGEPEADLNFADGYDEWFEGDADNSVNATSTGSLRSAGDQPDHPAGDAAHTQDAAMQGHYDAVLAILFPGDEREGAALDRPTAATLAEHVRALLADERLEELKFYADAERWFAEVIASAPLRSDPVLTQVIEHFGWLAGRGRIDQSPAIAAVVERRDALAFATELQNRRHPLHRAWRELRRPATETSRRGWGVRRSTIWRLLREIRTHHPSLERELDWYRVGLWERAPRFTLSWRTVWAICAVAFFILRAVYDTDTSPRFPASSTVSASAYASPAITLDPVLAQLGGTDLTMAKIRSGNAKLYGQLHADWMVARDTATDPRTFADTMFRLLSDRYVAGSNRAPHELLAKIATLRLDKARLLRGHDWKACDDFFVDGTEPLGRIPPDIAARRSALVARVLLETDGDPPAKPLGNTFKVDGTVIDKAAERSGLPRAEFVKAVLKGGNATTRCKAKIALGETALTLPAKQGNEILRHF